MMTRFRVKNYKCLKDVDIPLTPIHVLIGQNDAGKTSLLEAMYALFKVSEPTAVLVSGFPTIWSGRELVFNGSKDPFVTLGATLKDSGASDNGRIPVPYDITLQFPDSGTAVRTVEERVEGQKISSGSAKKSLLSQRNNATQGSAVQAVERALGGVGSFRFNPRMMAIPATIDIENAKRFELERDGFGLSTLLDDILNYDIDVYRRLQEALHTYFPHFTGIRLERTTGFRRILQYPGVYDFQKVPGKEVFLATPTGDIRLQQASDGVILLLGFLALCHVPGPAKLLLIEEPENGVYPKRLSEVVRLLKRFVVEMPNAPQIVLTTHSPYLMSEFEPEEITFMCRQPDGSVRARPLRDAPMVKERYKSDFDYLGELWYNYDEEVIFGDVEPAHRD